METQQPENWYVIFTRSRTEKVVAERISQMGFESFLPLHIVVRQWSDRKKKMEIPLFPNYVFVRTSERDRHNLFYIKELVRFVCFEKRPVVMKEKEIDKIKLMLNEDVELYDNTGFEEGQRVRIDRGSLKGLEGTVIKQKNKTRLIVRIVDLQKSLVINIPTNYLELTNTN